MGKRAAPDATTGDAGDRRVEREAKCRGTLEALNAQFAAWIARRAIESPIVSWRRGCEDYLKHLDRVKVRARCTRCFARARCFARDDATSRRERED